MTTTTTTTTTTTKTTKTTGSNLEIPEEFCPTFNGGARTIDERDEDPICGSLFEEEDDDDDDDDGARLERVTVGDLDFELCTPPDVGTLFAHRVWSGSVLLAFHVLATSERLVRGKRTVELGAGTALPSLVALERGSAFSLITDYPDDDVLSSLRRTVGANWEVCRPTTDDDDDEDENNVRVAVLGHEWGTGVEEIRAECAKRCPRRPPRRRPRRTPRVGDASKGELDGENPSPSELDHDDDDEDDEAFYFDVAFLSECLWMHRSHADLAASVHKLLHPTRGAAVLTYAHHVPGKQKEDDDFFRLCADEYGFVTEHVETRSMDYMWDDAKKIDVHLKIMRRGRRRPRPRPRGSSSP